MMKVLCYQHKSHYYVSAGSAADLLLFLIASDQRKHQELPLLLKYGTKTPFKDDITGWNKKYKSTARFTIPRLRLCDTVDGAKRENVWNNITVAKSPRSLLPGYQFAGPQSILMSCFPLKCTRGLCLILNVSSQIRLDCSIHRFYSLCPFSQFSVTLNGSQRKTQSAEQQTP